ncbi:MAG: T9SS type A sorting domain-containing protein [Bacteroidota bacterium]
MQLYTFRVAVGLCYFFSYFSLSAQITIDYPTELTVECGMDLTPSEDNPSVGYPDVSTTCTEGLSDISFSDNIDQLTECGGTGDLLRFWSVSDNCGGFMTLLQRITIEDTTPPEINCVADIIVDCEDSLNPAENDNLAFPTIVDCSEGADLEISYTDRNEGDGFCDNLPEIVVRTWTVTDACGNQSTCEQKIRVGRDPLLILCEVNNFDHECNGLDGSRFAAESWDLSNTNQLRNCTQADCGPVEIISDFDYGRISGSCGITGSFEVNYLIKDNCGNTKFRTVQFNLRDTTPPESFCNPVDFGVSCEGDASAASRVESWHTENIALLETCLFDNCGEVSVTSDFIPSTFDINGLTFDCNDDVGFGVDYFLTDDCGNRTVKTAFLKIVDNVPPNFTNVPQDTSIGANDELAVSTPTISDNCSGPITPEFSQDRIDNNNDDGYRLIRTWTATDDCGNVNTATQQIMVLDPLLSLACSSAEISVNGDKITISKLLAPNEIVKVFAADNRIVYNCFRNCGEVQTTRALSPDTYTVDIEFYTDRWQLICSTVETVTVGEGTGNDGNGGNNSPCDAANCEQEPPVLSNIPADATVNSDQVPTVTNPTASDNCDNDVAITFEEQRTDGTSNNDYILTRMWTATDDCGNTATAEQVIRVESNDVPNDDPCTAADCEQVPPILGNVPADATVNFNAVPAPAQPVGTDNCDTNVEVTLEETISESVDAQNYTLIRTWTAVDDCGNTASASQIISVVGDSSSEDDGDDSGDNGGNGGGNTDDDSGNGNDACGGLTVTVGSGSIGITGINAPNKIVKLFDQSYNILQECGDDCGQPAILNRPANGTYFVDIQLYSENWTFLCETRETVEVNDANGQDNGGGNDGNSGNDGGNDNSDGNNDNNGGNNDSGNGNPCESVKIIANGTSIELSNFTTPNKIVNIFDATYNLVYNCFTDCSTTVSAPVGNTGDYIVDIQLYDESWGLTCQQRSTITVDGSTTSDDNGGGDNIDNATCDAAQIAASNGQISVGNLTSPNSIVKVFSENYDLVYECVGNCGSEAVASGLSTGNYQVNIDGFDENWRPLCERIEAVTLEDNLQSSKAINRNGLVSTTSKNDSPTITVFPNPTTGDLNLQLTNVSEEIVTIRLYNQLGATVLERAITSSLSSTTPLDLAFLENGLYFLTISNEQEIWQMEKILLER